ncbi:methylthioadenosine phosphorylase [Altererythrobacter sp. B11]|uniref:S-methyl-5'-thioadenosine phosphorylase n=1 Tax=Altererythrobacter sp. B11 TaxID=2060312 RepID=UPI000DC6FBE8|nr:S-methyl-5'-thioadenosine phosphorylase [Altererythrobacter sp. B11]BBC74176.1 methylthioadenosine phosphorylase [Altererythrobacter sp. B11]
MAGWHLGVIGGSGLYQPGVLEDAQEIAVRSAFGEPSGPVLTGTLPGTGGAVRCSFIARHGAGHRLPPSAVNYRANIDVLKRCGVTDVVAISAVGSLREELAPGDFVVPDQFIDRTVGRERSFFGAGVVAHVAFADPVCPRLAGMLAEASAASGPPAHRGGCYVAIEGPQFSTRAESQLFRRWGADVIGMTAMPEARLAREAELPYALLAMVTDYDCWREGEAPVDVESVLRVMRGNADRARETLRRLAALLPAERAASPIDRALDGAIITPRKHWDGQLVARLDAIAGRLLRSTPADPA